MQQTFRLSKQFLLQIPIYRLGQSGSLFLGEDILFTQFATEASDQENNLLDRTKIYRQIPPTMLFLFSLNLAAAVVSG